MGVVTNSGMGTVMEMWMPTEIPMPTRFGMWMEIRKGIGMLMDMEMGMGIEIVV